MAVYKTENFNCWSQWKSISIIDWNLPQYINSMESLVPCWVFASGRKYLRNHRISVHRIRADLPVASVSDGSTSMNLYCEKPAFKRRLYSFKPLVIYPYTSTILQQQDYYFAGAQSTAQTSQVKIRAMNPWGQLSINFCFSYIISFKFRQILTVSCVFHSFWKSMPLSASQWLDTVSILAGRVIFIVTGPASPLAMTWRPTKPASVRKAKHLVIHSCSWSCRSKAWCCCSFHRHLGYFLWGPCYLFQTQHSHQILLLLGSGKCKDLSSHCDSSCQCNSLCRS